MIRRLSRRPLSVMLVIACAIVTAVAPVRAADPPRPPLSNARVVRVVGVLFGGGEVRWLTATPAEGGPVLKFGLTEEMFKAYNDLRKGKVNPRDQILKVTFRTGLSGDGWLTALEPYAAAPELMAPRAWTFAGLIEQTVAGKPVPAVKLSKYETELVAVFPNRPAMAGKPAGPDAALLDRVKALKVGDVVEVELQALPKPPLILVDIDAYRAPLYAEFVKLENLKSGGRTVPGVTLKIDDGAGAGGKPQSFLLPAVGPTSPPSAAALVAAARKYKPGDLVLFTARDPADPSAPAILRDLRPDAVTRPSAFGLEVVAPYLTLDFHHDIREDRMFTRKAYGHADDFAFDNGVRLLGTFPDRAASIGLDEDVSKRLKAIWFGFERERRGLELPQQDQRALIAIYAAWREAKDAAQRDRAEQQLCAAAAELSQRLKPEMTERSTTYRAMLTPDQVKAAIKMGSN